MEKVRKLSELALTSVSNLRFSVLSSSRNGDSSSSSQESSDISTKTTSDMIFESSKSLKKASQDAFNSTYNSVANLSQRFMTDVVRQPVHPISLKENIRIPSLITKQIEVNREERLFNLCDAIERASSVLIKSDLIADVFKMLYNDPQLRFAIYRKKKTFVDHLLKVRDEQMLRGGDKRINGDINQCLAILGHVDESHVKHRGLNILSIDGGGAKGFVAIEILKNIERQCGKPIHQIFDYISGVSTGACIAALLTVYKLSLDEVERQYKIFVKEIFQRNKAIGIGNLVMSQAYYDTSIWERMLQDAMGNTLMINSAKDNNCKISIVSNLTTTSQMKVYLFRNYNLPTWAHSQYEGTCRYKVWEAVRASSAAPGYYEDFKLDGYVFHDGGILANNPTAIAIHEAKQLWPNVNTNCIVSIGNGRYKPSVYESPKISSISLKQKINRIVAGVSCTQTVHNMLIDLLPMKIYFRFNPFVSEEFMLDENRPIKWKLMQYETNMYMRRNNYKFETCAKTLLTPKSYYQKLESILKKKRKALYQSS